MATLTLTRKRTVGGSQSLASFEVLVRKVREAFARGNRRIKTEMIRSAWQAGRYIHAHILHHRERAGYGDKALTKLSVRVDISVTTLERALNIYRKLPKIPSALKELELTHLYTLISVPDDKLRLDFAHRAAKEHWSTRKLESKIREEWRDSKRESSKNHRKLVPDDRRPLKPRLGVLYTYRLIESKPVQANPGRLKVDLGFRVHQTDFTARGELKADEIIESRRQESETYTVVSSKREESDLYTYKAWVERVVDGDTQFVEIDLGFSVAIEQYLRLREIDCPEISTEIGKKAKAFVEKCLKTAPFILLTSSRSDKYDRYLSDVFVPLDSKSTVHPSSNEAVVQYDGEDYLYLNNELLLRGLAKRMSG